MCMFSGPVQDVSKTQMFARASEDSQILVYSMSVLMQQEVAMILPLPVPPGSGEDAVRFINLAAYPEFFTDLSNLYPKPMEIEGLQRLSASFGEDEPLVVHQVGLFEASFVPSRADFQRLDPRFRLPNTVWEGLAQYQDWGFAVFKLKLPEASETSSPRQPPSQHGLLGFSDGRHPPSQRSPLSRELFGFPAGKAQEEPQSIVSPHRVHPMAMAFPRRDRQQIFFPTVHVHDGQVHPSEYFDHELFVQLERMPSRLNLPGMTLDEIVSIWNSFERYVEGRLLRAPKSVDQGMDLERAAGTLSPSLPVYRWHLDGYRTNEDTSFFIDG